MTRFLAALVLVLTVALAVQTWRANFYAGDRAALKREVPALQKAIADRDKQLTDAANREAAALTTSNRLAAGDVSAAFQKGVAAGRALANAPIPANSPPAVSGAVPGGVPDDFRSTWAQDAYKPASAAPVAPR